MDSFQVSCWLSLGYQLDMSVEEYTLLVLLVVTLRWIIRVSERGAIPSGIFMWVMICVLGCWVCGLLRQPRCAYVEARERYYPGFVFRGKEK
jgi:hypothetical protein